MGMLKEAEHRSTTVNHLGLVEIFDSRVFGLGATGNFGITMLFIPLTSYTNLHP